MHDLIIHNAKVIDGTGNPWFRGDVAVSGAAIAGDRGQWPVRLPWVYRCARAW